MRHMLIGSLVVGLAACGTNPPASPPAATQISSIQLTPTTASVPVGDQVQFSAVARDQNGIALNPQPALTWKSSDPGKASVNTTGLTLGLAAGQTQITAAASGVTSNAVTLDVTAGAAAGNYTVTVVDSGNITLAYGINNSGAVFYQNALGKPSLYKAGTKQELPALPRGYEPVYKMTPFCIDSHDNVMIIADNNLSGSSLKYSLFSYTKASHSYSELELSAFMTLGGCNDAQQVTFTTGSGTPSRTYLWTSGQPSAAEVSVPSSETSNRVGYKSTDLNNAGVALFYSGIVKGGVFTKIVNPLGSGLVNARSITEAGVVYGDLSRTTTFTWKEGDATATVLGRPPASYTGHGLDVIAGNSQGQMVLTAVDSNFKQTFWVYRNGAFELIPAPGYQLSSVVGLNDAGWILAEGHASADLTKRLVLLLKP